MSSGVGYMSIWDLLGEDSILAFCILSEAVFSSEDSKGLLAHVKKVLAILEILSNLKLLETNIPYSAYTPILWPPDAKNWLIGKDPDAGKDRRQEEKGDDRGWDGWMASLTRWTWVWASSRSSWWTGKPGVLQSTGSQRDRTERLNWTDSACLWRPSAPLTTLSKGCCQVVWVYLRLSWSWRDAFPIFLFIEKCCYVIVSTFWDHSHQSVIRGLGRPAILQSSLTKQKVL